MKRCGFLASADRGFYAEEWLTKADCSHLIRLGILQTRYADHVFALVVDPLGHPIWPNEQASAMAPHLPKTTRCGPATVCCG